MVIGTDVILVMIIELFTLSG